MIDASIPPMPVAGPLDGVTPMPNSADQVALNSAMSQLFSSMLSGSPIDAGDDSDSDEQ